MTGKENIFCYAYLESFNATEAALKAGYSKKTAGVIGYENLKKPHIIEYIKELTADYLKDFENRKLRLIKELESIAYSEGNLKYDNEGNVIGKDVRDKLKGLELLGKTMKMFSDKLEITGEISANITKTNIDYSTLTDQEKNDLIRQKLDN